MAKRGQFYILAAIIISIVIFGITVTVNKIEQEVETTDFVELAQNYVLETPELINYAIYGDQMPADLLSTFTEDFIEYARKRNPRIGLLYVYKEGDTTMIRNYLQEGQAIPFETETGMGATFGFGDITINEISLEIGEEEFSYNVPTKLENFGDLSGTTIEATKWVKLEIGGVPYILNTPGDFDFDVIIKGKSESGETEVTCEYLGEATAEGTGILSCE